MNQRRFEPLGDTAIIVRCESEADAVRFADTVTSAGFTWLEDVLPAYSAVGVHLDPLACTVDDATRLLSKLGSSKKSMRSGTLHRIPCCYEKSLDLEQIAQHCRLTKDEVISLHAGTEYVVYAVGFAPGFPYLGYLPEQLQGVPRLDTPRVRLEPGSIGLTGKQTGIYPLARPGGWPILGRTPLTICDPEAGYFPIRVGDRVRFEAIDSATFERMLTSHGGS